MDEILRQTYSNNKERAKNMTSDMLMLKNYQNEQCRNRLTNKYLKELSENYYNRKTKCLLHPNAGVVVLLYDDTLKSCDWEIGKLAELINNQ